ncbi:MAG TPA: acetyl-CoA carboxylase, carboxyltransferase subunit beta [Clostridia bacterium]|jgi:acetyl-CoA carboxylase carboxyl transferase beta subunit|nr:acetyl-CoA carboxylase carboxyltransferase subunit beta [Clostridiaceae bacterium]HPZ53248.1 acetyl-CoA carboxylase, carboxyltransferase subunit beta [Clostridia bacterium]
MLSRNLFKKPNNVLENVGKTSKYVKPQVPEDLWISCANCKTLILKEELFENNKICPNCSFYYRLAPRERLAMIVDEDSFVEHDKNLVSKNILKFPDYDSKLKKAKDTSNEKEAVVCGVAKIKGMECALFVMNSEFMMGSMGVVVGEKVTRLFEYATQNRLSVVGFTVSGGARMQEGVLSLMQMAKTSCAVKRHNDTGLLYITVLTDPTTGGVTASFAMEGDIILAEPGALIAFAGPRVIEQTIKQKLPEGFQRSEFLLEKGFIDAIVERKALRDTLANILKLH